MIFPITSFHHDDDDDDDDDEIYDCDVYDFGYDDDNDELKTTNYTW